MCKRLTEKFEIRYNLGTKPLPAHLLHVLENQGTMAAEDDFKDDGYKIKRILCQNRTIRKK